MLLPFFFTVDQQTAAIVTRPGEFSRAVGAGAHFNRRRHRAGVVISSEFP